MQSEFYTVKYEEVGDTYKWLLIRAASAEQAKTVAEFDGCKDVTVEKASITDINTYIEKANSAPISIH